MSDVDPVTTVFGREVRARRRALSMTQQGLADATGLHFTTIHRIESAQVDTSLTVASTIAEGLDTTVAALLGEERRAGQPDRVEIAAALAAVGKVMTDMAGWLAEKNR